MIACSCGSGLRAARCCELDLRAIPDATVTRPLAPMLAEALKSAEQDPTRLLACLELMPTQAEALRALYGRRAAEGNAKAARSLLERYVQFHPNDLWGRCELAMLLQRAGDGGELAHARNAVRLAPDNPRAHDVLGMVLIGSHRPQPGAYHCARAVALSGRRDPALLANMAWGLKSAGRLDEARAAYAEAAKIAPDSLQVNLGWGQTELAARDTKRATELLDRAARAAPEHGEVRAARCAVLEATGAFEDALALLDATPHETPELLLARGRVLDRLGRYDDAFAAIDAGKAMHRDQGAKPYPAEQVAELLARLTGFYTARRAATLPRGQPRGDLPQPIFILGFPRSGTTMLEQALSLHSQIGAGDELPLLQETAEAAPRLLGSPLGYPEALAELWMGDGLDGLDVLRDHYLRGARRLDAMRKGAAYFTDKMPLNETQMGLASLIFPQSPMIHLLRHPLDVVLSVYGTMLTHGFHCANALATIALHYARIAALVAHMRREMTPRYHAVRYEDLVDDLAGGLDGVLGFIGLPFEPACVGFHHNARYARTASQLQVTEPLYARSRYRWRNYRRHLEPIFATLAPTLEALGYETP